MPRRLNIAIAALTVVFAALPAPARADGYVTPFIGVNFANNSGDGRSNFGIAAAWMGRGIAGLEFDVGYAPDFFGSSANFGGNNVLTAMGNLIVGVPAGGTYGPGVRPYFALGAGLVRTQVNGRPAPGFVPSISDENFGLDAGGGVIGFVSDHVGFRGDVRYFRNFRESPTNTVEFGAFHFWRASFGIVLRP